VNGVRAGPADETVVSRCGNVPVVFMTPDMSWKSKARSIAIVCRKLNRVSIEPATTPLPAQPTPKAVPKPKPPTKTPPKTAPKSAPKGSQWLRR
jgi:hypothetical protein